MVKSFYYSYSKIKVVYPIINFVQFNIYFMLQKGIFEVEKIFLQCYEIYLVAEIVLTKHKK